MAKDKDKTDDKNVENADQQANADAQKAGQNDDPNAKEPASANLPAPGEGNLDDQDKLAMHAYDTGTGVEAGAHNIPGVISGMEAPSDVSLPEGYTGNSLGSNSVAVLKGGPSIPDASNAVQQAWQVSDNYEHQNAAALAQLPVATNINAQSQAVRAGLAARGPLPADPDADPKLAHMDEATQSAIIKTAFASMNAAQLASLGCSVHAVELVRNYRDEDGKFRTDYVRVQSDRDGQPVLKCQPDCHPHEGELDVDEQNPAKETIDMNIGPNR